MRQLVVLALFSIRLFSQTPPQQLLRQTHEALIASFLPVAEFRADPAISGLFHAASDGIWASAGQNPQFLALIRPFANLSALGSACGVNAVVQEAGTVAYSAMTAL